MDMITKLSVLRKNCVAALFGLLSFSLFQLCIAADAQNPAQDSTEEMVPIEIEKSSSE